MNRAKKLIDRLLGGDLPAPRAVVGAVDNRLVEGRDTEAITVTAGDFLSRIVGEIRGFARSDDDSPYYYQENMEPFSINGYELIAAHLDQNNLVDDYDINERTGKVRIDFSIDKVVSFMVGSGFRAFDYDADDAFDDIENDPLGMLVSSAREFRVRVDPYSFVEEDDV